jgi:2',3'-cyclic-nucleotide 2'-phosphodiesterase (5'-nucleotidase family)
LSEQSRQAELYKARAFLEGFAKIGCDAINVGGYDLAAGYPFLRSLADSVNVPFISANLRDTTSGELAFPPYRIVTNGPFKIGIVGVTNLLPAHVTDLTMDNYIQAGQHYLDELRDKVDVLVMLLNAVRRDYLNARNAFKAADYLFVSRGTALTRPHQIQSTGGPYQYSCGKQGKYLSVVELTITDLDSPFVDISASQQRINNIKRRFESLQKRDPERPLEEIYADQPNVLRLIKDYRNQLAEAEKTLARAVNPSVYRTVPMDRKIKDDPEMLAFVNEILAKEKRMKSSSRPPAKKAKVLKPVKTKK